MMRVKLVKPFRSYVKGSVLELPPGQGRELVSYGYAVEERQQQLIETAAVDTEARTADLTPKRRRRRT